MFSIYFNEEQWSYFVVIDGKDGDEAILAKVYDIETAEAARKVYENQVAIWRAEMVYNSDEESPLGWRGED